MRGTTATSMTTITAETLASPMTTLMLTLNAQHGRFSAERDKSSRHELSGRTGRGRQRMTFAWHYAHLRWGATRARALGARATRKRLGPSW